VDFVVLPDGVKLMVDDDSELLELPVRLRALGLPHGVMPDCIQHPDCIYMLTTVVLSRLTARLGAHESRAAH
jgi:hypothetical protein